MYFYHYYHRKQFRILITGGGTDGGTLYLAEQLNHTDAEIFYMDFSSVSKRIVETRTKIRNLKNVILLTGWIESIPFLGINKFELVICTGVLHHLKYPSQGLQILNDAQMDTGGANLMVYAQYGRTSIYHIQKLLRIINDRERRLNNEIGNAKALLKILPITNLYFKEKDVFDLKKNDIELYDRLMHKRDVSYNVVDLYGLVDKGGYRFVEHDSPESRISIHLKPNVFLEEMVPALSKKSLLMTQYIGEIFNGMIDQHSIYISKQPKSEALWNRKGNIIFANGYPSGFQSIMVENTRHIKLKNISYIFAHLARKGGERQFDNSTRLRIINKPEYIGDFVLPLSNLSLFVVSNLTRKPMIPAVPEKILLQFMKNTVPNYSMRDLRNEWCDLYWYLRLTGMFLLKKNTISSFPKSEDPNIRFIVYNVNKISH